jgi:hypothetical protein
MKTRIKYKAKAIRICDSKMHNRPTRFGEFARVLLIETYDSDNFTSEFSCEKLEDDCIRDGFYLVTCKKKLLEFEVVGEKFYHCCGYLV